MEIEIRDNNKIDNSNIGKNNSIKKEDEKNNIVKLIVEIIVEIIVTVIGGYILYKLNIN